MIAIRLVIAFVLGLFVVRLAAPVNACPFCPTAGQTASPGEAAPDNLVTVAVVPLMMAVAG